MASKPREGRYLTRPSYREATLHQFDKLDNIGFNWREKSLEKTLSRYWLNDRKRREILEPYRVFIEYIMDYASQIRKSFNYTVDKNFKHYV